MSLNKKAIYLNEKTYKDLEEIYQDFLKNKDKMPIAIAKNYGNTFDEFIDRVLTNYVKTSSSIKSSQEKFADMLDKADLDKLDQLFSTMKDIFGGPDNEAKKSEPKEKPLSKENESKIKN